MRLIEYKCPNCGAKLKIDSSVKDVNCQMCGSHFHVDDGTQRVEHTHKLDDPEGTAYKATRGVLRAQYDSVPKSMRYFSSFMFAFVIIFIIVVAFFTTSGIIKSEKEFEQTKAEIEAGRVELEQEIRDFKDF